MKKITLLLVLFFSSYSVWAQEVISTKSAEEYLNEKGEVYFSFPIPEPELFKTIANTISVDNIRDGKIYAYANRLEFQLFTEQIKDYKVLQHPGDVDFDLNMKDWEDLQSKDLVDTWDFYPTYPAYVALMEQFEADFPDLCKIVNIGQTVEGRDLLFAKVTADVNQRKAEPQFMYTSTMHGDETTGYVLTLRLIHYLLNNYGEDDAVTELLDNVEIWINPNANPDGTYAGGDNTVNGATRSNANWIDLNRNFPNPIESSGSIQPETEAMMNFADTMNFVMSANMHGGAEVVNFPFDSWTSSNPANLHADHNWWEFVSHEYADTAIFYSPAGYLNGFDDGISHGGDWYVAYGTRQDYMNYYQATREVTLELSDQKLLSPSLLPAHWEYNYRSFLNYIRQATYGVRGIVTDADSGEPLVATIEVLGHDQNNSEVYSEPVHGSFFRPLLAGTYDIRVTAAGYPPAEFYGVEVENYQYISLDVQLGGSLYADFTAQPRVVPQGGYVDFYDNSLGDILQWEWDFQGGEPATSSEQNPLNIVYPEPGNYDVSLTITDQQESFTSNRPGFITVLPVSTGEDFLMSNNSVITCSGYFYDSGGNADYSDNESSVFTFLPANQGDVLQFVFEQFSIEQHLSCNYDWLKIYDGPTVEDGLIGTYCGTNSPGTVTSTHPTGALTFAFKSDGSQTGSGWKAAINCVPDFRRLVVTIQGEGDVTLNGTPQSGDNPWYFDYQQEISLQADPGQQSTFLYWEVNGVVDNSEILNLTMDDNYLVNAVFGQEDGPMAVFEPDSLSFPQVVVGGYSEAVLNISNTGNENLEISLDSINPSGIFGVDEPSRFDVIIGPGGQEQLVFWFNPSEEGEFRGKAIFSTNVASLPEVEIALSGSAYQVAAIISSNISELDFGEVAVGETSYKGFSVSNTGNSDLVVDNVNLTDETFFLETPLPVTIGPGSSLDFSVGFSPEEKINYQANLAFVSNAANGDTWGINLSGVGTQGVFVDEPEKPASISLFPNPVNESSLLHIELSTPGFVEAIVFDIKGSKRYVLASGRKEAGSHEIAVGNPFSELETGVYFVRVTLPDKVETLRIIKTE